MVAAAHGDGSGTGGAGPPPLGWPCHSWSNRARACSSSLTVMVSSAAGCRLGPLGLAAWGGWGAAVGLVHAHGDDHAGGGREGRDRSDASAQQQRPGGPGPKATAGRDQPDRHGLGPHAAGDEPFAAHPVRQGAGDKLPSSPDGRVQRGQDADAADRQAVLAKNSGKMPQARPSLRLLTRPAWLQADRARSRKLVSRKTCLVDRPWWAAAEVFTWVAASCSAKARVSRTSSADRPRPSPA